jgi:hypothetical protein
MSKYMTMTIEEQRDLVRNTDEQFLEHYIAEAN